jgi:hypothetical protein
MVDDDTLRGAIDTAWSVYRTRHREVDAADSRRCLLERHLHGRREARGDDAAELTAFGIAYLEWLPEDECRGGWKQSSGGWRPRTPGRIGPFPSSFPQLS